MVRQGIIFGGALVFAALIGDPARLHQALANLLANARTHVPAGTTCTTRLRTSGPAVQLSVVDYLGAPSLAATYGSTIVASNTDGRAVG